ncbi:hypothetical protein [Lentzea sp. NPDC092896]|uniref:hypothetical protein n=1 Tax=Lentzea sp. NPDC092896 TaxID=3364127 RepID=UPI003807CFC5
MDPWLIVVLVIAGVVLIGFAIKAFQRLVLRSDGQNAELAVEGPKRKKGRFTARSTKSRRSKFKVRGADVELDDSDFTDSSTDVR